jgi:4-amino-4-deoxy-L-arabinose transferase-like glycosyltransferase
MLQKESDKHQRFLNIASYIAILIIIYFVFFQRLGSNHMRPWDESMFAVNAYEMVHNNNYFVPYYKGVPDFWNLKPPLQLWVQVFFIKLLGLNEIAIRLPSAIAMAIMSFLLFFKAKKILDKKYAWCVFLVFVTSSGLTDVHMARSGDADSLLSLFIFLTALAYYNYISSNQSKAILVFFLFLTLATITKSVASLLIIPGIIAFTIWQKKMLILLKNPWFYLGSIAYLSICVAVIFIREAGNPGYLNAVYECDILRLASVRKSTAEPFLYYLNNFFEKRFIWFWLFLPGFFMIKSDSRLKPFATYIIILASSYFFIISTSISKLEWYDMPLYPFMAIICAFPIYKLILSYFETQGSLFSTISAYLLIFSIPVYFSFRKAQKDEIPSDQKKLEQLYKYAYQVAHGKIQCKDITFLNSNFDRPLQFYKYMINAKGCNINIVNTVDNLIVGLKVAVANEELKTRLEQKFELEEIEKFESVSIYQTLKFK